MLLSKAAPARQRRELLLEEVDAAIRAACPAPKEPEAPLAGTFANMERQVADLPSDPLRAGRR